MQQTKRHLGVLVDDRLGGSLRLGIRPARFDRGLFINFLPGHTGLVHEHGTRVNKTLDGELGKRLQQVFGALYVNGVVQGRVLARKIKIRRQMYHRRHRLSVVASKAL